MLYAQNSIPKDEFWHVYDYSKYRSLRSKVGVHEGLADFYDKTHQGGGEIKSEAWREHEEKVRVLERCVSAASAEGKQVIRGRTSSQVSHVTRGEVAGTTKTSFRSLNRVVEINEVEGYA
jgi:hypothetical protein